MILQKYCNHSYCFRLAACHDISDGAQLSVDVIIYHAVPLAKRVQSAQDGNNLLSQRAAVSGCERRLRAGLPPSQGALCVEEEAILKKNTKKQTISTKSLCMIYPHTSEERQVRGAGA